MKEQISALMDGELDDRAAGAALDALAGDREAQSAWRTYHLIGDAMRESRRPAAAPVVALKSRRPQRQGGALALAASLAAVALVGWLAFAPQPQAPQPALVQAPKAPATVPLPTAANDYLLAHQGFSPRVSLQGMAPYVRTVSEHREETQK
jgi:sigma-E factor negative regulatory protein RseA